MVFEDDVVLCRGFGERLAGIELPNDWAVLYFGCVFRTAPEVISPELLRVTGPTWDMHAYLLRREVWEKVSQELGAVSWKSCERIRGGAFSEEQLRG
jgi:hypothetical protein